MHILVAGGAGYVGSKLVPALLTQGYQVTVLDLYLYGESLKPHPHLREIKGDIRDLKVVEQALSGCDAVIHLACISNDPSFELNPALGKSINFDSFEPFVRACKAHGVHRFIYASSSSVYGVKEEERVHEGMSLEPLTDYSRFKADCEKVLLRYLDDSFTGTILRPATVCGYAPRQRLDVVVNIFANQAYHTKKVKIMGGSQKRANIHIDDMVDAYLHVLKSPSHLIQGEIFNVGHHNHSVLALGELVAGAVGGCSLEKVPTQDLRSYQICSEKISKKLAFYPKRSIEDAVKGLVDAFQQGKLPNALEDKRYYNIKMMKEVGLQ